MLWCFPLGTLLCPLVLWCRSRIRVLEGCRGTPAPPPPIVYTFHLSNHKMFPLFFTELLSSLKKHSMLFTFLGSRGANILFGLLENLLTFVLTTSRRLVRACHRPCLMSVRRLCPLPSQHWRLPLCLSPVAHLHQRQSRLLQARWDAEKDVLMTARANLGKNCSSFGCKFHVSLASCSCHPFHLCCYCLSRWSLPFPNR